MPYCDRKMAKYMRDKGLSQVSEEESSTPNHRKLRQLPSSVDPMDDDDSSSKGGSGHSKSKHHKHSKSSASKTSSSKASSSRASSSKGSSATSSKGSSATSSKGSSATSSKGSSAVSSSKGSSSALISSSKSSASRASSTKGSTKSFSPASSKGSSSRASSKSSSPVSSSKASRTSSSKASSSASSSTAASSMTSSKGRSSSKGSLDSVKASASRLKSSTSSTPYSSNMAPDLTFDEKKLLYMKSLLKSNVDRLSQMKPALPADSPEFSKYTIDQDTSMGQPNSCKAMVKAVHRDFSDFPLVCKQYDTSNVNPNTSIYLKIVRHLGKKHPNIIQTWDVFYQGNNVLVIQEFACHGHLGTWLDKTGAMGERASQDVAKQLFLAMDYMGDMAVAHRGIMPRHILVCHRDPLRVKLSGFGSSVVYWNVKREDIANVPCIAVNQRPTTPDYQAPEVYGDPNKEEFDPVTADIWSLGAIIYFTLTKGYPYDASRENPQIEEEIQSNVQGLGCSGDARQVISRMLMTNANDRIQFDKIQENPWMKQM